jgi:hypothetical protein
MKFGFQNKLWQIMHFRFWNKDKNYESSRPACFTFDQVLTQS